MMKYRSIRAARKAASEEARRAWAEDGSTAPINVLLPDGDTLVYQMVGGRLTIARKSGHCARGLHIDPCDLPCLI